MALSDKIKNMFAGGTSQTGTQGGGVNKKALVVGVLLVVSVLVMVVLFSIESGQTRKNKLYASIASQQQVISQQIAVNALEAAAGQEKAFDNLATNQKRFLANLDNYNNGVPAQDLPKLFEPFFTTVAEGSGMGLYLCKELCEINNASLSYRPTAIGESCFRISLSQREQ